MAADARSQVIDALRNLAQLYGQIPASQREQYQPKFLEAIERLQPLIESALAPPAPEIPTETPLVQVTDLARNLWTLAKGNPDVFEAYANSYPDRSLQSVANNPVELNALIQRLSGTQEIEPRITDEDGIRESPIKSSNVFGYRYDPLKKRLTVRFNEGSVYRYEGVPQIIFDMFRHGEGVAKTTGSNRWGKWWKGKSPSISAALNQLIKIGGYPYTRIK